MAYKHLRYISGYYDDATNLYKLGARNYDPTIGRFTQYDPSGQEAHPYAYATCNPINAKDPTGLSCGGAIFGAITGVIASTASIFLIVSTAGVGGAVGAIGFSAGIAGTVYSVGDAINTCR